ncbi:glycosyltransferase family 39 protein [Candidatus Microgenomates bacterium]|nr:glycosyltransferase family 39 protein [Candidatus Microgenomates bacterium]
MGKTRWILLAIIVLASLLRLWRIDSYPNGFTPDEASFGYDAYSILKTGKDQWGQTLPLTFRSFGDFKAPLYTYLAIPTVAIFGLNEFAVRLPNAILGILGVLIVFLLVKELFKEQKMALLSALLLAVSPWHMSLSRGAFEANLTTLLLPLGIWLSLKGIKKPQFLMVAAVIFGLNLFSYHSAKLLTPLIVLMLLWWKRQEIKKTLSVKIAVGIFLLFLSISFLSIFGGSTSRAGDIAIFNPTGGWGAVADRRYEAVQQGLPDITARIFSNKLVYITSEFIKNYFSYLSPIFLFTQGAGEWTYGMIPGMGALYLFELPFILVAIWAVIKKRDLTILLIVIWVLLAPIPAALTKGPGFAANRAATMMPAIQIFSAFGAVTLFNWWRQNNKLTFWRFWLLGYWAIGLVGILFFLESYFYHAPIHGASSMLYGRKEAMDLVKKIEGDYKQVIISRSLSEPHIYVAFYNQWDAGDYQKQSPDWLRYEKEGRSFLDQLGEYHLGKYIFRSINYQEDQNLSGVLLVGQKGEFPEKIATLHTVIYPDGKPAVLIVDPSKEKYAEDY